MSGEHSERCACRMCLEKRHGQKPDAPSELAEPLGSGNRRPEVSYIVQEWSEHNPFWQDDPEQPESSKRSKRKARQHLSEANAALRGHVFIYRHRLVKRVETQLVPPNTRI